MRRQTSAQSFGGLLFAATLALACQFLPANARLVSAQTPSFLLPTAGYVGLVWANYSTGFHNGIDIWTAQPNFTPCGNEVRAAFPGTVYKIKKFTSYTDAPNINDPQASIIVLRHTTSVAGLPNPFYTWYLHLGKEAGTGTCIDASTCGRIGQSIPAGTILGRQGDMKLAGDQITHLHFMISNSGDDDNTTYNPASFLGLPNLQTGQAVLYSGQTAGLRLDTNAEEDSVFFFGTQGATATIRMNRRGTGSTLDPLIELYAPSGSFLVSDDDGGANCFSPPVYCDSLINSAALPSTGLYRIKARSYNHATSGLYNISLTLSGTTTVPAPTNLARGKPTYATSVEGNLSQLGSQFATDGNTTTRWSSADGIPGASRFELLIVDLGSAQTFNRVVINWEAAYTPIYAIVTTNNFVSWGFPYITVTGNGGVDTINLGSQTARYVGVLMLQGNPTYGNISMWEFELYNVVGSTSSGGSESAPSNTSPQDKQPEGLSGEWLHELEHEASLIEAMGLLRATYAWES